MVGLCAPVVREGARLPGLTDRKNSRRTHGRIRTGRGWKEDGTRRGERERERRRKWMGTKRRRGWQQRKRRKERRRGGGEGVFTLFTFPFPWENILSFLYAVAFSGNKREDPSSGTLSISSHPLLEAFGSRVNFFEGRI